MKRRSNHGTIVGSENSKSSPLMWIKYNTVRRIDENKKYIYNYSSKSKK